MKIVRHHATTAMLAMMLTGSAFAADLDIPPPVVAPTPLTAPTPLATPRYIPIQQNQPNCSRWTDECIVCTRGADGVAPTCSNIGIACQPKPTRCMSGDTPQNDPLK